ncbi:MAG: hypothetical protein IPK57_10555 [Chitinophagaceae bacterium]|nr:hypothetical protein [Chitinophagaceae bacterium]
MNLYREDSTGKLVKATGNMLNGKTITPNYRWRPALIIQVAQVYLPLFMITQFFTNVIE